MNEIRCTRENVRETVSDLFPDPTEGEEWQIEGCVTDAAEGLTHIMFPGRGGVVHLTIVPGEPLSTSQAAVPISEQEDDAWRAADEAARTSGQEEHAARRHAPVGYYARTVDERLPTEQDVETDSLMRPFRELGKKMAEKWAATDNANTGEVGTFTDGPEERYSVGKVRHAPLSVEVVDRMRSDRSAIARATSREHAQLIVDALNAWEASQ